MLNDKTILITGGTGSFGKKCLKMIFDIMIPFPQLLVFCLQFLDIRKLLLQYFQFFLINNRFFFMPVNLSYGMKKIRQKYKV